MQLKEKKQRKDTIPPGSDEDPVMALVSSIIRASLDEMYRPILSLTITDDIKPSKVIKYLDAYTSRNISINFFTKSRLFMLTNLNAKDIIVIHLKKELERKEHNHSYKQWLRYRLKNVLDGDLYEDLTLNNRNYKKALKLYKKYKELDKRQK